MGIRAGVGIDVHAFSEDLSCPLFPMCLRWPGERRLGGRSDADIVVHAACDAVPTTSGVGDLGTVFGTKQPEQAGASGNALLAEVMCLARTGGWATANVSIQIADQHPRFLPCKAEAERAMGDVVGAPIGALAITTDRLSLIGQGEGLTAIATALVHRI